MSLIPNDIDRARDEIYAKWIDSEAKLHATIERLRGLLRRCLDAGPYMEDWLDLEREIRATLSAADQPSAVTCVQCGGSGDRPVPNGDEDRCPRCWGHGSVEASQLAECPECDGQGTRVLWDDAKNEYGPLPCPDCGGTGKGSMEWVEHIPVGYAPCQSCNGTGRAADPTIEPFKE